MKSEKGKKVKKEENIIVSAEGCEGAGQGHISLWQSGGGSPWVSVRVSLRERKRNLFNFN
jgi:hypothetical protein